MTGENYLFLFIVVLLIINVWAMFTSKVTPEERDEMLNDNEMWP